MGTSLHGFQKFGGVPPFFLTSTVGELFGDWFFMMFSHQTHGLGWVEWVRSSNGSIRFIVISMGFYDDLMGFYGDFVGFYGDLLVILWDFMVI